MDDELLDELDGGVQDEVLTQDSKTAPWAASASSQGLVGRSWP